MVRNGLWFWFGRSLSLLIFLIVTFEIEKGLPFQFSGLPDRTFFIQMGIVLSVILIIVILIADLYFYR